MQETMDVILKCERPAGVRLVRTGRDGYEWQEYQKKLLDVETTGSLKRDVSGRPVRGEDGKRYVYEVFPT